MKKGLFEKVRCCIRKWFNVSIIPKIPLNGMRIFFYRLCGYNIGKNCFIGMMCYLDDLEPKLFVVEDNVTISYGCYFCCHGKNQKHTKIHIKEGAYLGMQTSVISGKSGVTIEKNSIVGARSVVIKNVGTEGVGITVVGNPAREVRKHNKEN